MSAPGSPAVRLVPPRVARPGRTRVLLPVHVRDKRGGEQLRSRVLGATTASFLTITPLGGLAAGFLVGSAGLFATTLAIGCTYLLATLSPVIFPAWKQTDAPDRPMHD